MFDLHAYVAGNLQEDMKARFEDRALRRRAGQALMDWLRTRAKVRPLADLPQRLERMERDVEKMVERMEFQFDQGKVVIKVNGSDEDTLKAFRLGTAWFEPNPDLIETILTGLFDESS